MSHALLAFLISVACIVWINLGVAFINGILWPSMFQPFYAALTPFWRMMVLLLPVFGMANWAVAYAFQYSPAITAPTLVATGAFCAAALSLGVLQKWPNMEVSIAFVILLAAAVWFSVALGRIS